ncbi:MAG: helicase-exonuclease AddAB subunit AddA [Lachnospiraceae bacterium]|nr:helicase-exonuclease AddAB subunit AddA [Lachnospiraceae bacterium]
MSVAYTADQQKVFDARDCNILVSAAAGSGKTAVLVERIVRLVEEGADIDRMLVVTFTNAAAAEMRERITKVFGERLLASPDNLHLQKQMTLIHNAHVSTIDSFCNFVLRNNFNDIGLDPAFRTATEEELKPLMDETLQTLFEEKYAEEDADFLDAVECFHPGGDDKALAEQIGTLLRFADNEPFPEAWLKAEIAQCKAPFDQAAFEDSKWGRAALAEISRGLCNMRRVLEEALLLAEDSDGPDQYAAGFAAELETLESIEGKSSFFAYKKALTVDIIQNLSRKKPQNTVDPSKQERAKTLHNTAKEILTKLREDFTARSDEEFLEDMNRSRHITKTLAELTLTYMERAMAAKREENLLTFSDIEHLALSVLVTRNEDGDLAPTAVAEDYRTFFKEIMIDEYQDSSMVQEIILSAISGEKAPAETRYYNRFMVGDVKQSIYRFRQAKPQLFIDKYKTYKSDDASLRKIILQQNFRSRAHVLSDINSIFEKCMHEPVGGVEYDAEARLNPNPDSPYPQAAGLETECLLLTEDKESGDSGDEQEARLIANRIVRLMREGQVYDKESGQMRSIRFSDIAILSRSNWFSVLRDVLSQYGIPAHAVTTEGYFKSDEIRTLMNFIRVLDNPMQDIPLFGVMHSVLGGFSDEELALLKAGCPEGSLYAALQAAPETLRGKCTQFLQRIERYREKTTYMPIRKLLQEILTETGYREYQAAFPEGEQRAANIDMLLQRAGEFEKNGAYGLFQFIRYIDQLDKFDTDNGEANTTDEYANVVRLMTIHKSKGLEFPVCILAKMDKRFNTKDETNPFLLDDELGSGCDAIYPDRRLKRRTIVYNLIKRKMRREMLGEEIRLLYVAMTRAKEKLIMTACVADPDGRITKAAAGYDERAHRLLDSYTLKCTNYLDFVLPIWERVTILDSADLTESMLHDAVDLQLRKQEFLASGREKADDAKAEKWRERFSYRYPHEDLKELYTKTTVSELKIQKLEEENEGVLELFDSESKDAYVPRFARTEEKVSGSAYGSAMHLAMEKMDFADRDDHHAAMAAAKASEEPVVNITKIERFLSSDAGRRMRAAAAKGCLFREKQFMFGLPASEVKPGFPEDEVILIQGIIDAYWEEDDGYVILDYKTDHIEDLSELPRRYQTQLDYYARALSGITGKPVKERILYSFCLDNAVKC